MKLFAFMLLLFSVAVANGQPDEQLTVRMQQRIFTLSKDSTGKWVVPTYMRNDLIRVSDDSVQIILFPVLDTMIKLIIKKDD